MLIKALKYTLAYIRTHRSAFGIGISFLSILFLVDVAWRSTENFNGASIGGDWPTYFSVAVAVGVFGHGLLAFTWWLQLKFYSNSIKLSTVVVGVYISQLGKYLPGNVMQYFGRAYFVSDEVGGAKLMKTFLLEAVLLVLAACILSGGWGVNRITSLGFTFDFSMWGYLAVAAISFGVVLAYRYRAQWLVTSKTSIVVLLIFMCSFLLHGGVIYMLALGLFDVNHVTYVDCMSAFSLAFVVGYLLPGASGGLGVRELAFVMLLTPELGEIVSISIIVLYRLASIVADLIVFSLGLIMRKKWLQGGPVL